MISALAQNRVIGNKNKIPWHIKEDLIHFKEKTVGHAMIMGRKTFESLMGYYQRSGKPIPKRINIVVTRDKKSPITKIPNVYIANSIEDAIKLAKNYEQEEVFIAGGAQVYQQGIKYADKLYLTIIKGEFAGDAFFPDYSAFKKVISERKAKNEKYSFTFLTLEK